MQIIKGKIQSAKKVVIYGLEGIGKSTLAAQFPNPLFIDTEGSTKEMDIARLPKVSSWAMILDQINYVKNNPAICKSLVIDTIDWAEQMSVETICAKYQKNGIEDFGYGNGYVYVKEELGRFLNQLEEVVERGIHVVLTAHAQIRKFEQPDELGAYDRYELKLGKKTVSQTSPMIKEWADMVLFANYKTYSIAIDDKGKKNKAQGGMRVMYTSHHPCWDAKNRFGLPDELPFEFLSIAHIFEKEESICKTPTFKLSQEKQVEEIQSTLSDPIKQQLNTSKVPKQLMDLMNENNVDEWDIQSVVAKKGYYPSDMKIEDYDPTFLTGVLVGAWQDVYKMIKEMKEEIPF